MWLVFTLISMLLCAIGGLVSKKAIQEDVIAGPFMVYFASSIFSFLSSIVMWILGVGESGASPVSILISNPLIILSTASTFLATFLVFVAYEYVGISVESAVSNVSSVLLFLGLVGINVFTAKLESVKEILVPGRLIPIIVIIVLVFVLSKTDEVNLSEELKRKSKHKFMLTGILILLASCVFDALDSLIVSFCIGDGQVGAMDYCIATSFMDMVFGAACLIIAIFRIKKAKISYKSNKKNVLVLVAIGLIGVGIMLTYFIGSAYDAVKLALLYIVYPIIPLVGARIFLKERYTAKQYICIIGIAIASIVFCIMDYV